MKGNCEGDNYISIRYGYGILRFGLGFNECKWVHLEVYTGVPNEAVEAKVKFIISEEVIVPPAPAV